ncbi:MAG: TlpA disulfide reductase family protein [Byssovorax sp.]
MTRALAARARRALAAQALLASILVAGIACSSPAAPPPERPRPEVPAGRILSFSFETVDGKPLSTETVAGRFTVIGFIATYDIASQAEARFIGGLARHHAPRINAALLALEPRDNLPLVQAFAQGMGIELPVALADAATIAGEGPFAGLHHVPSVVLLDRQGREVWRRVGLTDEATIELALRAAEASSEPR